MMTSKVHSVKQIAVPPGDHDHQRAVGLFTPTEFLQDFLAEAALELKHRVAGSHGIPRLDESVTKLQADLQALSPEARRFKVESRSRWPHQWPIS